MKKRNLQTQLFNYLSVILFLIYFISLFVCFGSDKYSSLFLHNLGCLLGYISFFVMAFSSERRLYFPVVLMNFLIYFLFSYNTITGLLNHPLLSDGFTWVHLLIIISMLICILPHFSFIKLHNKKNSNNVLLKQEYFIITSYFTILSLLIILALYFCLLK